MVDAGKTIMEIAQAACDIGLVKNDDIDNVYKYCSRLGLRVKDATPKSSR